ncbi:hypothetical protein [Rheinheimera sp. EpRS3]|uniref:hypothetical protein n=1 Tax=Rheinheimera sp. EpRS3 TaxID=1712383 RepID=UPI00074A8BE7|nr:hypothetical protein [Rheinheimera sp. EpRS3]KUM53030.1 hypothetical protein AR688_03640 [Rheinheimera sp. EpRS3]
MSLIEKYIKLINDSSHHITFLVLLTPAIGIAMLFSPDVEYTTQRITIAVICALIFAVHTIIGICALIKKQLETALNFLILPVAMGCFVICWGGK